MSDDYKKIPWWTFTYPEHFDIANKVYSQKSLWRRLTDTLNETFNPRVKHSSYWFFLSGLMIAIFIGLLFDYREKITIIGCVLATIVTLAVSGLFLSYGIHEWKKEKIRKKLKKK